MTELRYYDDSYLFEDTAQVTDILPTEDGRSVIILDGTIFYPQGGGQPYDTGKIQTPTAIFDVEEVRLIDGTVHHIGRFVSDARFSLSDTVTTHVNKDRRRHHARLHSGGHILDIGMREIGQNMRPLKGYHFPDGPYVEYEGDVPVEEREDLIRQLETTVNNLITKGHTVTAKLVDRDKLAEHSLTVPDHIPADKPSRVVTVYGELGIPCGGTHVKDIKEIGPLKVTKVKAKDGKTRVSYSLRKAQDEELS